MQPFPSPLEPVPQLQQNDELITKAEKVIADAIRDMQGDIDGDILAAWDIVGTAAVDWQRANDRTITNAERKINNVLKAINKEEASADNAAMAEEVGGVGKTAKAIEQETPPATRQIEIYYPPSPQDNIPKACLCAIPIGFDLSGCIGTCGTIGYCDPVTNILVRCLPYNCGDPVPPGWCYVGGPPIIPPPPPEPPYPGPPPPEPPPEEECCPKQVIQVYCGTDDCTKSGQTLGECKEECEEDKEGNGDDYEIKPQGESDKPEELPICAPATACTSFQAYTYLPMPLARKGKAEPGWSECGINQVLSEYGDSDPVDTYLGHEGIMEMSGSGNLADAGEVDSSRGKMYDFLFNR